MLRDDRWMLSRFRKWNFKQNFETEHSFHQSVLFKPLPFPLEKHNLEAFPPLEGILEKKKKGIREKKSHQPLPSLPPQLVLIKSPFCGVHSIKTKRGRRKKRQQKEERKTDKEDREKRIERKGGEIKREEENPLFGVIR